MRSTGYLKHLNGAAAPSKLAEGIFENKNVGYVWLDLYIGSLMHYGDESTGGWGAHEEIWTRMLKLWASLVK
jgi:hypothetical protein